MSDELKGGRLVAAGFSLREVKKLKGKKLNRISNPQSIYGHI